nr:uncharacterized protein LOC129382210 [Dermacentor andersoni]XP_054921734.1 uncharacterized protein LOC129382210 [Dermacentor andersoni]XP_054921735.1 uncharacterized protein LOC129382210 [Dermacentor andersoni]XP_054921736.1 uncharacterized protein LOC129382210 [Dermacentor andersoni]
MSYLVIVATYSCRLLALFVGLHGGWLALLPKTTRLHIATSFPPLPDRPQKRWHTKDVFPFFGCQVHTFPRFHVVLSEKPVRTVSPFLVSKSLSEIFGPGYKASRMASGDLFLELHDQNQYEKLPKLVSFGETQVIVTPHRTMNTTRGVVSDDYLLELTEAELLEGFSEQNVINVKRIKMRRDGKEIHTKHLIITFGSSILPESMKAGYIKLRVWPYVPNPLRCFKCQCFGHSSQSCRGRQTCAKCSPHEHASEACENSLLCVNCHGEHAAYSRSCPSWKKEKEIVTIKVKENISFKEARRRVSYLPKSSFAGVARQEAAPKRLPAAVRPTSSESAVRPPAPVAVAASAAPSPQTGPSTSEQVASKASSNVPRPSHQTKRSEQRVSSTSQEAMDTTTSKTAPPAPKEWQGSLDSSKKDKTPVRTPAKGP